LGYVLMNPSVSGVIESKIVVVVTGQRSNQTYTLDLPIIGRVHKNSNIFEAVSDSNRSNSLV